MRYTKTSILLFSFYICLYLCLCLCYAVLCLCLCCVCMFLTDQISNYQLVSLASRIPKDLFFIFLYLHLFVFPYFAICPKLATKGSNIFLLLGFMMLNIMLKIKGAVILTSKFPIRSCSPRTNRKYRRILIHTKKKQFCDILMSPHCR